MLKEEHRKKGREGGRKESGKERGKKKGKNLLPQSLVWKHSFLSKVIFYGLAQLWKFPKLGWWALLTFTPELHTLLLRSHTRCPGQGLNNIYSCRLHPYVRMQKRAFQSWLVNFKLCVVHCMGNTKAFSRWHFKSVHFCKEPSHFWEIAPSFSFPSVVLELLFFFCRKCNT